MQIVRLSCARRGAAGAMLAGTMLGCAALLLTACGSSGSTSAAGATSTVPASTVPASTVSAAPSVTVSSAPATPAAPASTVPASTVAASPATSATASAGIFLASGQDVHGVAWHEPACASGCVLSGDSTAILLDMTWSSWSATRAVGSGMYKIDACNPSCAAGPVYPVAAVVTLSQPVKFCSASWSRWYWSRAAFAYPHGLPKALRGASAPRNPWVFSTLVSAARQSCSA